MRFALQSSKAGVTHKPPRIVLLGVEKIGKSTFATGSDNPIVLPIKQEEGVDDLDCDKFDTAQTFNDVLKAVGTLVTEQHDYKTFIIDSASTLEPLIWKHLCDASNCDSIEKVGGGYGKGYTEAANTWRTLMEGLDALRNKGIAVILIGHVKVKRFDDPLGDSYDQYQFDVHEKVSNSLFRWSDCILFANTKTAVKKEDVGFNKEKKRAIDVTGQRFLFTQKTPGHPGGGRGVYGRLPYELPLDWQSFTQAVSQAAQSNNNNTKGNK